MFYNPNKVVRCFFVAFPVLGLPTGLLDSDAPPPGVRSLLSWSRVKILHMLGEGVTSSFVSLAVEGHVCSHNPSSDSDPIKPECSGVSSFFFMHSVLVTNRHSGYRASLQSCPCSGFLARSGVLALSSDWTRPNLANGSVLFLRIGGDRVHSGARDLSHSGTLTGFCCFEVFAAWLGPATAWEVGTSSTSTIPL